MTGRRACDGPSCRSSQSSETQISTKGLWRSVTPVTVRPAIPSQSSESWSSVPNFRFSKCFETRPCDGSSCPWRSVLRVRHRVQRVDFSTQISEFLSVLGRDTIDGPSCSWRSVVGSVVSACFSRNKICCSKRLNRSLQFLIVQIIKTKLS